MGGVKIECGGNACMHQLNRVTSIHRRQWRRGRGRGRGDERKKIERHGTRHCSDRFSRPISLISVLRSAASLSLSLPLSAIHTGFTSNHQFPPLARHPHQNIKIKRSLSLFFFLFSACTLIIKKKTRAFKL